MVFRWRADDDPFIVIFGSSIPSSTKKKLSNLDPLWQNFLDPHMKVFNDISMVSQWFRLSSCGQQRLIRLSGCPGWSESLLRAHVIHWERISFMHYGFKPLLTKRRRLYHWLLTLCQIFKRKNIYLNHNQHNPCTELNQILIETEWLMKKQDFK